MLLARLVEQAPHRPDLPPPFYRQKAVRWVAVIDADGNPLVSTLQDRGDPRTAALDLPVPDAYRSGQRPPPLLLVDKLEYAFGVPKGGSGKDRRDAAERHAEYLALLDRWHQETGDPAAAAVRRFCERVAVDQFVPAQAKASDLVAFRVAGEWAHLRPSAVGFWASVVRERKSKQQRAGHCLVCGEHAPLLDSLPGSVRPGAIPVPKGRGDSGQLVSVNAPAQGRDGIIQLASIPICEACGGTSIAVLNSLLADERHRHRMRDSVLVWWVPNPAEELDPLGIVLSPPGAEEIDQLIAATTPPDPGAVSQLVGEVYKPVTGRGAPGLDPDAFCAVTLSLNKSRVVVRDWIDVPVAQVKQAVGEWFDEHRIASRWHDRPVAFPLGRLVLAAGRWQEDRKRYDDGFVPDGLERRLLTAAFKHAPLPASLIAHAVQRVRADGHVDEARAALLRLLLIRSGHATKETCMPSLDPDARDAAYHCGRAFALLEQIQWEANRDREEQPNTTITDRLFRRAVSSPSVPLVAARKLAEGHLRKLRISRNPQRRSAGEALKRRLDDVFDQLDQLGGIPMALDHPGQARFILGYHSQRAADARARARSLEERPPAQAAEDHPAAQ